MSLHDGKTIVALATAPLTAGVAVVRLSGQAAFEALPQIGLKAERLTPRMMTYCALKAADGTLIDRAMVVSFPAPHSFTGEHVIEIHLHGGMAIVQTVLAALCQHPRVRPATNGEFSRQAFINGKMDLLQAEAIADLIAAETEQQAKQALNALQGETSHAFEAWRSTLMHNLAHTEAALDFPDEELDVLEQAGLKKNLKALQKDMAEALNQRFGERLRKGFTLAIVGKPNAGKSTLLNLLSGEETAIVSPIAGTTRDIVETHLNIDGFPVVLADTAGLRQTEDLIEAEGVKRALQHAERADVCVVVIDASDTSPLPSVLLPFLQAPQSIVVFSKADKASLSSENRLENLKKSHALPFEKAVLSLDLTEKESRAPLSALLSDVIRAGYAQSQSAALITRQRHRESVQAAHDALTRALQLFETPTAFSLADLLAQDLRDAARAIGQVTGRTSSEDVLDLVFSTFCIGK